MQVFCLPLAVLGGPIVGGAYWLAAGYLLSVDGLRARQLQPAAQLHPSRSVAAASRGRHALQRFEDLAVEVRKRVG